MQSIHNVSSELHHLVKHILHTPTETSPVGRNNQRQFLSVKIVDSLCSLIGAVREPNLPCLTSNLCLTVTIGWVCRYCELHSSVLHGHHTDWYATEPCPPDYNCLSPGLEDLIPGILIKQSWPVILTCQQVPGVVTTSSRRLILNVSLRIIWRGGEEH